VTAATGPASLPAIRELGRSGFCIVGAAFKAAPLGLRSRWSELYCKRRLTPPCELADERGKPSDCCRCLSTPRVRQCLRRIGKPDGKPSAPNSLHRK
jgi:hypothetical protein